MAKLSDRIILFDIDGTLFDSRGFGMMVFPKIVKLIGKEERIIKKASQEYFSKLESGTDFQPDDFLQHLSTRFSKDLKSLKSIFNNKNFYRKSLYEEVPKVLKRLIKNFTLGIYSEGFIEFQKKKLIYSGIFSYFDSKFIYISRRKLKDINKDSLPKRCYIVDNSIEVVKKLAHRYNSIWINRENKQDSYSPTITSLDQLINLL